MFVVARAFGWFLKSYFEVNLMFTSHGFNGLRGTLLLYVFLVHDHDIIKHRSSGLLGKLILTSVLQASFSNLRHRRF